MAKKITLTDVATHAGVSSSTVSITLSGKNADSISLQTQDKVRQAAKELGYQLKPRKPRTRKNKSTAIIENTENCERKPTIALIVDSISLSDPFLEALNTVRKQAWHHGFLIAIYETDGDDRVIESVIEQVNSGYFVGVLFSTHRTQSISSLLFSHCSKPVVLLNCHVPHETRWPTVLPGDLMGGYQATLHLIEEGCSRIAHITGDLDDEAAQERLQGYQRALISHDIMLDDALIRRAGWFFDDGYRETKALLQLSERPDAIFCCNDTAAMGCYFAICDEGLKIPGDIAVVGYDNLPIGEQLLPKLSSMILPYGKMGQIALELLLNALSGQAVIMHTLKVESELIIRESSQLSTGGVVI